MICIGLIQVMLLCFEFDSDSANLAFPAMVSLVKHLEVASHLLCVFSKLSLPSFV